MSRVLAIAIAAVLACGTAGAQTQSTTPTTDPGTKLAFPANLGGATFERSVNYAGPPTSRPDRLAWRRCRHRAWRGYLNHPGRLLARKQL